MSDVMREALEKIAAIDANHGGWGWARDIAREALAQAEQHGAGGRWNKAAARAWRDAVLTGSASAADRLLAVSAHVAGQRFALGESAVTTLSFPDGESGVVDAAQAEQRGAVVAWVRFRSDGGIEGPIMDADSRMSDTRRQSGAWTPLYTAPPAQAEQRGEVVASEWRKRFGENPLSSTRRNECDEYTWRLMVLCQDMMAALERTAPPAPVVPDAWREVAEQMRNCVDCAETDVADCRVGSALWNRAAAPKVPRG